MRTIHLQQLRYRGEAGSSSSGAGPSAPPPDEYDVDMDTSSILIADPDNDDEAIIEMQIVPVLTHNLGGRTQRVTTSPSNALLIRFLKNPKYTVELIGSPMTTARTYTDSEGEQVFSLSHIPFKEFQLTEYIPNEFYFEYISQQEGGLRSRFDAVAEDDANDNGDGGMQVRFKVTRSNDDGTVPSVFYLIVKAYKPLTPLSVPVTNVRHVQRIPREKRRRQDVDSSDSEDEIDFAELFDD